MVLEEHILLVQEPGSDYLGHVTYSSGIACNTKQNVTDCVQVNGTNIQNLTVVGCDGTAINTEYKAGVIRLIEQHFKRPVQWLVLMLHANEPPLRHLSE